MARLGQREVFFFFSPLCVASPFLWNVCMYENAMRSRHCGYNSQCYITVLLLLNLSIIQAMNWLLCCVIGFKELHLSPGWSRPFCCILAPSLSFCLYHAALLSYSIDSSIHPLHSKAFFFFFFFHLHLLHPLLDLLPCGKKRGRKKRQKEKDYFFFCLSQNLQQPAISAPHLVCSSSLTLNASQQLPWRRRGAWGSVIADVRRSKHTDSDKE